MNNKVSDHRKNPRKSFDKYRLEWHIGGNYSINADTIAGKAGKKRRKKIFTLINLLKDDPTLDKVVKYRQDWIIVDSNGRTNKAATKERTKEGLIEVREEVRALECDMLVIDATWNTKAISLIDLYIANGFKELSPPAPPIPKVKKTSKRKLRQIERLASIEIPRNISRKDYKG